MTSLTANVTDYARGSPGYRAPEMLIADPVFNNKVDIWSLGCILYELSVNQKLFRDDYDVMRYNLLGESLIILLDEGFSQLCKECITRNILNILQIDPSLRPSAMELFEEFQSNFQSSQIQSDNQVEIHQEFGRQQHSSLRLELDNLSLTMTGFHH